MDDLLPVFKHLLDIELSNGRKMDRLIELLERDQKEWLDPDEACTALGFQLTQSGNHRRRLKWCRTHGFLTSFSSQRPFTYNSEEVRRLAEKIRNRQVHIPAI